MQEFVLRILVKVCETAFTNFDIDLGQLFARKSELSIHLCAESPIDEIDHACLIRTWRVRCRQDAGRDRRKISCFCGPEDHERCLLVARTARRLGDRRSGRREHA